MTDLQLLEKYVRSGSPEAFAQLVARHADWVHSLALRQVRDPHMAEDVTQAVFLVLAQKARSIRTDRPLNAWLFNVARYSCAHALRAQSRRQHHERAAAAMNSQSVSPDEKQVWEQIAPRLEEAVERLASQDRDAILLRVYQRKSMAEVGLALGVSEDAAKKRVAKAVERLRAMLAFSSVAPPAGVLMGAILTHATCSAPASVATACSIPIGAEAAVSIAKGVTMIITRTKLVITAAVVGVIVLVGGASVILLAQVGQPQSGRSEQPVVSVPASRPATTQAAQLTPEQRIANRVKCAANMRSIGLAVVYHASRHGGQFPASFAELVISTNIVAQVFICPNADAKEPPPNIRAVGRAGIAAWVEANADYVYLGKGMTSSAGATRVIAYEKVENERQEGMNILFADGHVDYLVMDEAQKALNVDARARINEQQ